MEHRPPSPRHIAHLAQALLLERCLSHRQHLVDQEELRHPPAKIHNGVTQGVVALPCPPDAVALVQVLDLDGDSTHGCCSRGAFAAILFLEGKEATRAGKGAVIDPHQ